MIELINLLLELFKGICELLYCPEWLVNEATIYVGLVVTLLLLGSFLYKKAILPFFLWRNQKLLNKDLHPYYSPFDVERTTRYYVPVKYQNLAPSEDQNPGSKYIATAKEPLIPLFVNKAFKNSADDNKYYMILADSGMGKTTFMINLYLAYKNKCRFFWQAPKYEIKLFPLAAPNILEIIEKVPNQENTILLLDAFDEDLEALKDHKKRLNEILDKVHRFREIVITCRTQFFPTEEEEPHKTGYRSYGEQGEYKFQKLYLSVFDDKAVKLYLKKRFSIFQRQKRKKAFEIAQKSPSLIMRPMLLSYIEDLVDTDKTFEFSFQIYEVLIDKWLEREANKPKMTEKYGSEAACKKALLEFSEKLAVDLYENKQKYGGYSLPRGKDFCTETISILDIEKEHEDKINKAISAEKTAKSKSLLNRNAKGDYKFSHKSILEYFLAKECFNNSTFYQKFNFDGMDATERFLQEMSIEKLRQLQGEFKIKIDDKKAQSLISLSEKNIATIEYLKIENVGSLKENLFLLYKYYEMKVLILKDEKLLEDVYLLYIWALAYWELELRERLELLERLERLELRERLERLERLELREQRLELLELLELRELLERLERLELLERRELLELLERRELRELLERREWREWRELYVKNMRRLSQRLKNQDPELMQKLKKADELFKEVRLLQEKMPNCKIIY